MRNRMMLLSVALVLVVGSRSFAQTSCEAGRCYSGPVISSTFVLDRIAPLRMESGIGIGPVRRLLANAPVRRLLSNRVGVFRARRDTVLQWRYGRRVRLFGWR